MTTTTEHRGDFYYENDLEVCPTCALVAAGYSLDELGEAPEYEPLSGFRGRDVVLSTYGEAHFSAQACDSCGDPLAGDRYGAAVTIFDYDENAAAAADLLGLARFDCEQADAERRDTGHTPEHRALEQALPGNGARWATRQECADVAAALGDEAPTYPARVGALRAALRRRIRREFS